MRIPRVSAHRCHSIRLDNIFLLRLISCCCFMKDNYIGHCDLCYARMTDLSSRLYSGQCDLSYATIGSLISQITTQITAIYLTQMMEFGHAFCCSGLWLPREGFLHINLIDLNEANSSK